MVVPCRIFQDRLVKENNVVLVIIINLANALAYFWQSISYIQNTRVNACTMIFLDRLVKESVLVFLVSIPLANALAYFGKASVLFKILE
jgi:hypothetical protein